MEELSNPPNERELGAADNECFSLMDGAPPDEFLVSFAEPNFVDSKVNMLDGADMPEKLEVKMPTKKGKYNLRKSLAWDSAFFTSSGVLDAEELSSIIGGSNSGRDQIQQLPGIQEDVTKSTDSLSTLENDNLTLEGLEADLFCDIRASIQRSGKSSKSRVSGLNGEPEETNSGSQPGSGKKTIGVLRGNMVKLESVSKKPSTSLKGDRKLMKLGPVSDQSRKPAASRRETHSSLSKLPATTVKGIILAAAPVKAPMAKRMSTSTGQKNVGKTMGLATGCRTSASNGPRPGDSGSIIPRTASSASLSSTTTRTKSSSTRSSYDSTGSSSETPRILPRNGLQGKTGRTLSIPPPGLKSRIPSRVPMKGKIQAGASRISSCSSTPQISPSVSPASSISDWSSSSSIVTVNQIGNASKDCSNLHGRVSLESNASQDAQTHHRKQSSNEHENEVIAVPTISAHELLGGDGSVADPVSSKPSGLRMPSPKIGFFDGAKAAGRNPKATGDMQPRSGLPRNRALKSATTGNSTPNGVSSKARIGHGAVKAATVVVGNSNPDTERINAMRSTTEGKRKASNGNSQPSAKASLHDNGDCNSPSSNLLGGRKHLSESGSSSRKRSLKMNASPKTTSHPEVSKISGAAEADHHRLEICDDSKMLDMNQLHKVTNGVEVNNEILLDSVFQELGSAHHQIAVVVSGGSGATGEKHNEVNDGDKVNTEMGMGDALRADHQNEVEVDDTLKADRQNAVQVISGIQVNTELHQASESQEVDVALKAESQNAVQVISGDQVNIELHQVCVSQEVDDALKPDHQNKVQVITGDQLNTELHQACVSHEVDDAFEAGHQNVIQVISEDQLNTEIYRPSVSQEVDDALKADHQNYVQVIELHQACVSQEEDAFQADHQNAVQVINEDQLNTELMGDALKADNQNAVRVINVDQVIIELHQACVSQEENEAFQADHQIPVQVISKDQLNTELHQPCVSKEGGDALKADNQNTVQVINVDQVNAELHQVSVSREMDDALKAEYQSAVQVINEDQLNAELHQVCVSQVMDDALKAEYLSAVRVLNGNQLNAELHQVCVSQKVDDALIDEHENADQVVVSGDSGGSRTGSGRHHSSSSTPTAQQNVETEGNNNRELSEEFNGNLDSQSDANLVCEEAAEKEKPKQTELTVSRKSERNPGCRTPFADKNSLSEIEVLVKSFTSLSLDNFQTENC